MVGHHDAIGTHVDGCFGIVHFQNAFQDQLPWPAFPQPFDGLPGDGSVELGIDPLLEGIQVTGLWHRVAQIAEGEGVTFYRYLP